MAQNDNFFAFVKPIDNLAREHGFTRTCGCFENKTTVLFYNLRVTIDDFLLPASKMHFSIFVTLFRGEAAEYSRH